MGTQSIPGFGLEYLGVAIPMGHAGRDTIQVILSCIDYLRLGFLLIADRNQEGVGIPLGEDHRVYSLCAEGNLSARGQDLLQQHPIAINSCRRKKTEYTNFYTAHRLR